LFLTPSLGRARSPHDDFGHIRSRAVVQNLVPPRPGGLELKRVEEVVVRQPSRREFAGSLLAPGLTLLSPGPPQDRPEPSFVSPRKGWTPGYVKLAQTGELRQRARALRSIYESCRLCPRRCGVNRRRGQTGVCSSTARAKVFSFDRRFAEERPLTGTRGSGAIFFE
jgi:putative pyruvate formate lyase activating enzyme